MRAVFFGTPEWAVPSLDHLASSAHQIASVVSQPDRRAGRRRGPEPPPVARRAKDLGLHLHQPETIRTAGFLDWFRDRKADVGVIVAYGEILPRRLLEIPAHGFVNLHFSLLPKYRGAAPVQWVIASGESMTGVTTMAVAARLDAGDIYLQREAPIEPSETAPSLGRRLAALGAGLLVETLDRMHRGDLTRHPQDERRATYAPALTREDAAVDWSWEAEVIARRVRAFDAWPGCATRVRGRGMRLLEAQAEKEGEWEDTGCLAYGTVLGLFGEALRVVCGEGTVLRLIRMRFEGGGSIAARDAVNGRLVAAGDLLGEEEG